jgi:hypothetical protein
MEMLLTAAVARPRLGREDQQLLSTFPRSRLQEASAHPYYVLLEVFALFASFLKQVTARHKLMGQD